MKEIRNYRSKHNKKAGIEKEITVDTLQQSFAAHLLKAGIHLTYVQSLLSHETSKAIGFKYTVNKMILKS